MICVNKKRKKLRIQPCKSESLPQTKQKMMDLAWEKEASSWLSALPLQDQGFDLNKEDTEKRTSSLQMQRKLFSRSDICAKGFWSKHQEAFFYIRVFHPNALSYRNTSIPAMYRQHEIGKKREYTETELERSNTRHLRL